MKNSSQWDVSKSDEGNFWVTSFGKEIVCPHCLCSPFPGAGTRTQRAISDQVDKGNFVGMAGPQEQRNLVPDEAKPPAYLWNAIGKRHFCLNFKSLNFGVSLSE